MVPLLAILATGIGGDYMARDIGAELKQYMINLFNSIGKEVDSQFGKWNKPNIGFLAQLCAAHDQAMQSQLNVLKAEADELQRTMDRMLFAMQLLSIGAISWIGAALEYRIGPKFFYTYEVLEDGTDIPWLIQKPKEFEAKLIGDLGQGLLTWLTMVGITPGKTDPLPDADTKKIANSPTFGVFANNLYEEVDKQRDVTQRNINMLSQAVNNSATFGPTLMKRLARELPGFERMGEAGQFAAGKIWIDNGIGGLRLGWIKDSYYYRCDPPQPNWSMVGRLLEKEAWAFWLIQQNLFAGKKGWNLFAEDYVVKGASGSVFEKTGGFASAYEVSPVTDRLSSMNAPVMDFIGDSAMETHTEKWADEKISGLKSWAKRQNSDNLNQLLEGKPRALKPVDQIW